ncbi:UPF0301 protein YqgE [hydrothermal vent metagenome]|uniref:UPF0301 protein YqgE n=1 Tax=hydrothermal vent metagenome TaxID=652676 RepID=A0A3B0TKX3_9ZZZZ
MLIAMPSMGDPRFGRSVVFVCAHSKEGAMGIVVNKLVSGITFPDLLEQLDIEPSASPRPPLESFKVHFGGPVETARGFVLHSADYQLESSSMAIDHHVSLTATVDILKAIAAGEGPDHTLLALGYAGWSAGQLENEIRANGWLHCDADEDLLFNTDVERKYDQALAKIGVNPSFLSGEAGNA